MRGTHLFYAMAANAHSRTPIGMTSDSVNRTKESIWPPMKELNRISVEGSSD